MDWFFKENGLHVRYNSDNNKDEIVLFKSGEENPIIAINHLDELEIIAELLTTISKFREELYQFPTMGE